MRRLIVFLLVLTLVSSLAPGISYATEGSHPEVDPEVMAAFGLVGRQWIEDPKEPDDYWNNFMLSFAAGDWEFVTDPADLPTSSSWFGNVADVATTHNSLLGVFQNQPFYVIYSEGKYYINTLGVKPQFSEDDLLAQQNEVFLAAKAIHDEFWTSWKIRDEMTEAERFQVYYNYLSSLYMPSSSTVRSINYTSTDLQYRTVYMDFDSAYGALINHVADCGGKSAIANLLAHLEGIQAFGLFGQIKGIETGHILSLLRLDGDLYISDFGNRRGTNLFDPLSVSDWFTYDSRSFAMARNCFD